MSTVEVSRDALIDLASRLVRIPSFCPDETPVARFLEGYFRERGYEVQLQEVAPGRFQTIATWRGTGGGRSLMLNGHLDINSLARGWTRDPFEPWIEGDRLYGHGVQNMKGGVATMIEAVEALRRAGHRPRGDIVLACVAGETQGGEGSRYLAEHGPRADMAVLPEPYGLGHLVTVHGGIVHLAIHTYGVTGHISQIEQTVSAVVKMTRVVQALQSVRFTFEPHPALPALPRLNVGSIIGGRGDRYVLVEPPYVPDLCTAIVDVHFVPGQTVESIVADLRRTLEPLRAADPELRYEIEIPPPAYFKGSRRLVMQPVDVPVDTAVVRTVARHHEAVTGKAPAVVGALLPMSYSAGDASWLWGTARIPSVYYGPGGGFLEPGPGGSYALIGEMVTCAKVLALTALDVTA